MSLRKHLAPVLAMLSLSACIAPAPSYAAPTANACIVETISRSPAAKDELSIRLDAPEGVGLEYTGPLVKDKIIYFICTDYDGVDYWSIVTEDLDSGVINIGKAMPMTAKEM